MSVMTLSETCKELRVSRRTIQGYEQMRLLQPSGKNDRGWLLYDENILSENRIRTEAKPVKTPLVMVPIKRDYISSIFLEILLMLLDYLFIQTVIVNSIMSIPPTEIVISP